MEKLTRRDTYGATPVPEPQPAAAPVASVCRCRDCEQRRRAPAAPDRSAMIARIAVSALAAAIGIAWF